MATWILGPDGSGNCCDCQPNVCDPCSPNVCPPPTSIFSRFAFATLGKCGFDEFPGHASSPPKTYRSVTLEGTINYTVYGADCLICASDETDVYGGTSTVVTPNCASLSSEGTISRHYSEPPGCVVYVDDVGNVSGIGSYGAAANVTYTNILQITEGTGVCSIDQSIATGIATATLSNEYTTVQLTEDTENAVPAFAGAFSNTNPYSANNLSTDEDVYSIAQSQYYFNLDTPNMAGITNYVLNWQYVWVPDSGGSSVIQNLNYTWDGFSTNTPVYTLLQPGNFGLLNGFIGIGTNVNPVCT